MTNDAGSDTHWRDQAQVCYDKAKAGDTFTRTEQAALDLMSMMKDEHEQAEQGLLDSAKAQCSMWSDLLGAALSEVNWHEIAEHFIADVDAVETEAV